MSKRNQDPGRGDEAQQSPTDAPAIEDLAPDEGDEAGVTGGIASSVLNQKALSLPKPSYPPIK